MIPTVEMIEAGCAAFESAFNGSPNSTELVTTILVAALAAMPPEIDATEIPRMRPIPIAAAKRIATEYGYDQVLIYARRCHDTPEPHGEHMTTYGRNPEHCSVAARIGATLKKFMGWEV